MIPRNGQPAKKKNNTNSFVPILSFSHRLSCFNSVNYHLYTSSIDRITHNTARLKKYKPSALQRCGLPKETTKYVIITPKGNQKKREEEEQKQNPCQVLASKSKNLSLSLSLFPLFSPFLSDPSPSIWAHLLFFLAHSTGSLFVVLTRRVFANRSAGSFLTWRIFLFCFATRIRQRLVYG